MKPITVSELITALQAEEREGHGDAIVVVQDPSLDERKLVLADPDPGLFTTEFMDGSWYGRHGNKPMVYLCMLEPEQVPE